MIMNDIQKDLEDLKRYINLFETYCKAYDLCVMNEADSTQGPQESNSAGTTNTTGFQNQNNGGAAGTTDSTQGNQQGSANPNQNQNNGGLPSAQGNQQDNNKAQSSTWMQRMNAVIQRMYQTTISIIDKTINNAKMAYANRQNTTVKEWIVSSGDFATILRGNPLFGIVFMNDVTQNACNDILKSGQPGYLKTDTCLDANTILYKVPNKYLMNFINEQFPGKNGVDVRVPVNNIAKLRKAIAQSIANSKIQGGDDQYAKEWAEWNKNMAGAISNVAAQVNAIISGISNGSKAMTKISNAQALYNKTRDKINKKIEDTSNYNPNPQNNQTN